MSLSSVKRASNAPKSIYKKAKETVNEGINYFGQKIINNHMKRINSTEDFTSEPSDPIVELITSIESGSMDVISSTTETPEPTKPTILVLESIPLLNKKSNSILTVYGTCPIEM